jgi:hypothetical protein
MNYAIQPITDKRIKSQLLFRAHDDLYRRHIPKEEVAVALRFWVGLRAAETRKDWGGEPVAEKGILEAPENQPWINALVQEALEGAEAVQAQISNG